MRTQLSITHLGMSVLILIVCGLILVGYGWISFATFTERTGLYGDSYRYYQTDRIVFGLYKLLIASGALWTIIRLLFFVYENNKPKVTKTFIYFAIFIAVLVLCEIYLNSRFVGKG